MVSNGENLGSVNCGGGGRFCHGDDYYNVQFYDMSIRPVYDKGKQLNTDRYFNRPHWGIEKLEELAQ